MGIANRYFGGDVSVAGLLTGGDVMHARDQLDGEFAMFPRSMFKSDEDVMLDGTTLTGLATDLGVPIYSTDLSSFAPVL